MAVVHWSLDALEDYDENVKFIERRFNEIVTQAFIDKAQRILELISERPRMFQRLGFSNIHSVPVVPQITLYYRIIDANNIELVRFWNNYKDPSSLSL